MAKFKKYLYEQKVFIPIDHEKQLILGTFEYTLNYLVDNHVDFSIFDGRYNNYESGAPISPNAASARYARNASNRIDRESGRSIFSINSSTAAIPQK